MLFEFETNIYERPKNDILDLDDGFTKGNMFADIYDEYKDYKPKMIKAQNEREALLFNIYKLDFAINDLNLYLALNPDDKSVYQLFTKYCLMYRKCVEEYEKKYQVLELTDDIFGKYTWGSNPWPWEGEYV